MFIWVLIRLLPVVTIGMLALDVLCATRRKQDSEDEENKKIAIRLARMLAFISFAAAAFLTIATSSS
jgi:hypothetical protein